MKISVGDRVQLANTDHVGTVRFIRDGHISPVLVEFDAPFEGHYGNSSQIYLASKRGWWASQSELTVVATDFAKWVEAAFGAFEPETPGSFIVARIYGGRPCPSTAPYVHLTEESATVEAERLATANPGQSFDVYARVSRSEAPKPVAATVAM